MQCSSVGCSLAQWKDRRPWRPEFGPQGKLWGVNKTQRSCDGGEERAAPGGGLTAQKDGCTQRTGAPTKRQVSKRQVSKRLVSKRPVSKRQVYKTSGLQNVRFTKRQVSKRLVSKRPVFKFYILIKQKV